ncbi:MAG: dTMP kinase [Defluviitaleaceae bacterium]|nr:dTMP kinase [Defluviitaleaceae bacterium]
MSKFIVFEGLDGSGKSTQVGMLLDYLNEKKISHVFLHFPRITKTMIGEMIASFLRGEFGAIEDINPYFLALMYAQDRHDAKPILNDGINNHQFLIVDRYVYSNIAFQCAKVHDQLQKETLRNWILKLEYEHFALPKPDLTLFLKPPYDFVKNNLANNNRIGSDRDYLKGGIDIHENDLLFQKEVEHEYLKFADIDESFSIVNYQEGQRVLDPSEVSRIIIEQVLA